MTDKQTSEQSHKQTPLKTIPPWLQYAVWVMTRKIQLKFNVNEKALTECKPSPTGIVIDRNDTAALNDSNHIKMYQLQ